MRAIYQFSFNYFKTLVQTFLCEYTYHDEQNNSLFYILPVLLLLGAEELDLF